MFFFILNGITSAVLLTAVSTDRTSSMVQGTFWLHFDTIISVKGLQIKLISTLDKQVLPLIAV